MKASHYGITRGIGPSPRVAAAGVTVVPVAGTWALLDKDASYCATVPGIVPAIPIGAGE